jgi:hypothetical protein
MSTTTGLDEFNLRDEIRRIDRAIGQTHELRIASGKFRVEQAKRAAGTAKPPWNLRLSPWLVMAASASGGVVVAIVNHSWK